MEWGQKKEGRGRIAEGPGDEEIKTEEYEGTSAWFNFVNLLATEYFEIGLARHVWPGHQEGCAVAGAGVGGGNGLVGESSFGA